MHALFRINREINQGLASFPVWEWLSRGLKQNLKNTTSFYRRFPGRVDGSHFLIKLIYSMAVGRNQPLDRFYATAQARALAVSQALRMTSSISRGEIFNGVFYGDGVKEILIAHDAAFDYEAAAANWRELRPIEVLHHPKSDLMLNVPDGTTNSAEEGVAVIAVNVPMLVLQYREYQRYEDAIALAAGDSPRGVTHYIYSYALTNMLFSHLDVAIFNRLYNLRNGIPLGESRHKHSFLLQDYTAKLTEVQLSQLRALERNPRKFDAMMKMIPLVTAKDLSELASLPDMAPTRQVVWALATSRLQLLSFLFEASPDEVRQRNAMEVNRIVRTFELFEMDLALQAKLPIDTYLDVKRQMDRIRSA